MKNKIIKHASLNQEIKIDVCPVANFPGAKEIKMMKYFFFDITNKKTAKKIIDMLNRYLDKNKNIQVAEIMFAIETNTLSIRTAKVKYV